MPPSSLTVFVTPSDVLRGGLGGIICQVAVPGHHLGAPILLD